MGYIKLECPNCRAALEIDPKKILAYCPYCGTKLTFDAEQLSSLLKEKEKTKQIDIATAADVKKTDIQTAAEIKKAELEADHEETKMLIPVFIIFMIIMTIITICGCVIALFNR